MAIDKNADFTPSIPDSDVVPTKLPYNQRGGFKFWAQKVIPLVYDDSLSYYEVLCKVVNYLNNVIQNVDNLNESVNSTNQSFETLKGYVNTTKDTLINTYNELQDYVNTYFDNLDVQEEINAKLDAMADSGELTNLLAPFIPDLVTQWLNQHVTPTSPVIDDTLTISGAGADAKVTGDQISNNVQNVSRQILHSGYAEYSLKSDTSIQISSGEEVRNPQWDATDYIFVGENVEQIETDFYAGSTFNGYAWYDEEKTYISGGLLNTSGIKTIEKPTTPTKAYFIRLSKNSGGTYIKYVTSDSLEQLRTDTTADANELKNILSINVQNVSRQILHSGYAEYSLKSDTSIQISSGEEVRNPQWDATDYIFVGENVKQIETDFYGGSSVNGYAWYDEEKTYISGGLLNTSEIKTIEKPTTPTKAYFIRLSKNSGGTYIKYVTSDSLEQLRTDTANEIEQESKEFHNLINSLYSDVNAEYKLISDESVNISNGTFVSNPGWYRTGFIEIPVNVSKISTDFYGGSSVNGYAWYDSDKNYISGNVINFSGEKVLTPPTNAKYIVLSKNTDGSYVKFLSQKTLKNVLDIRENGGITITPSVWGENQSIQIATGNVVKNPGFYRFSMTEIPVGAKFLITNCTATSSVNGFAFYDSNGEYISGALINFPDGWYTTIIIPKNAKFVAGCDNSGNYATRTIAFAFNNLYGRSLYSDGDSIAAGVGNNGRNYATIMAEKYGMRLNDQAVGGGTLAINTYDFTDPAKHEHWISDSVPANMNVGYDYAIIEGGFNDEGHNVPIGSLSNDPNVPLTANPDKTTMIGALESIFQYIMKNYPKTKIFFLCVHRIYKYQTLPRYSGGQSYGVYLEKARECCARYGVEVIDVFNDANLNTYLDVMSQKFMYDNDRTHPNEDGYQLFYVPQCEKHMLID